MKIQFLNGGLANQVFQYIFVRYAELSRPDEKPWILDDSFFFVHDVHNGYELEKVFGLKPNLISQSFDEDVWSYMIEQKKEGKSIPQLFLENGTDIYMLAEADNYKQWNPFNGKVLYCRTNEFIPELLDLEGDVYYHGYWINKHYFDTFREQIRSELTFPEITDKTNLAYQDEIRNSISVSLHIRRGDFVTCGWQMNEETIRESVKLMKDALPKMTLFVFSDDIPWCREHAAEIGLNQPKRTVYIEGNKGETAFRDMQLMSQCRNMVIGPSSFNYLAALLNTRLDKYLNLTGREI